MKFDMGGLVQQAKKMQEQIEKTQEELATIEVEGRAGGGMVTVTANGRNEILSMKIDPEVLSEDPEMLEDLMVAAVNQALSRSTELANERMKRVTGGMMGNLPAGFKIPGMGS